MRDALGEDTSVMVVNAEVIEGPRNKEAKTQGNKKTLKARLTPVIVGPEAGCYPFTAVQFGSRIMSIGTVDVARRFRTSSTERRGPKS